MTQAKHTPGPWFSDVDGFGSNRVGAFGFDTFDGTHTLAQVRSPEGVSFDAAKANARLIAAAPDLLTSLRALLDLHIAHHNLPAHAKARAAIAKATGEAKP